MKILVTGCAGYIGSMLTTALVRKFPYWDIVGIDNLLYNQMSINHLLDHSNFTFFHADVRALDERIEKRIAESDVVFPFAALVGMPVCKGNFLNAFSINANSLDTLFKLCPDAKYIFPTTNSGYGIGQTDEQGKLIYCTEETPLNPISIYGKSKVLAEQKVLEQGGISLRLATVHGLSPRPRLDLLVNDFTFRAIRDKTLSLYEPHFKRNYIHIEDVVSAMLYCYGNYESMKGQVYNLGSEENLSKLELAKKIQTRLLLDGINIDIRLEDGTDPDQRNYIVSNEKIHKAGFTPVFAVEDTIAEISHQYDYLDYLYKKGVTHNG